MDDATNSSLFLQRSEFNLKTLQNVTNTEKVPVQKLNHNAMVMPHTQYAMRMCVRRFLHVLCTVSVTDGIEWMRSMTLAVDSFNAGDAIRFYASNYIFTQIYSSKNIYSKWFAEYFVRNEID